MTLYEIITKKKHNAELSTEEINRVVAGFSRGDIPDYQMSALLMAICFNSLSDRETADLTMAMAHSGDMLRPETGGFNADKHSTGGVGDYPYYRSDRSGLRSVCSQNVRTRSWAHRRHYRQA